jgi:hypothetical protein
MILLNRKNAIDTTPTTNQTVLKGKKSRQAYKQIQDGSVLYLPEKAKLRLDL